VAVTQSNPLSPNPLAKYMRSPVIYIKLPSGGNYWPTGSLEMPINGELPVLSMNSTDELIFKSPDALMNGQAVIDVIESCFPNIKNAWEMPIIDLDHCLIAIRIASYGENMEYSSRCTGCNEFNEYEIDLRRFLDLSVNLEWFDELVKLDDLSVKLKPQNYKQFTDASLEAFEQQRLVMVATNDDLDSHVKMEKFNAIFRRISSMTTKNIADSVEYITTGSETITDRKIITDFIFNANLKYFNELKKRLELTSDAVPKKEVTTTCPSCNINYSVPFTFDQANFFASAS
jgi:hypothetical protein